MEKQYKPVPNQKCLKYHGTPWRADIKIFSSHRIDLDSETVYNPLYIPVRCGTVFDERKDNAMLGDDTGDNISEKRESFCEFTVQYWAWKNIEADYYGLCHYRRYLSFSDQYFECNEPHRFAVEDRLGYETTKKYGLLNSRKMRREILKYDVITSVDYPVNALPFYPKPNNEYELWTNHPSNMLSETDIKLIFEIVKEKFPQYYDVALEVMGSSVHKGFNCFIMKRELFHRMCEFEFEVLFEFEKRRDMSSYGGNKKRTPGYLGEILYGTYMLWLKRQPGVKIKETQIVLYNHTEKISERNSLYGRFRDRIKRFLQHMLPAYRVSLRTEEKIDAYQAQISHLSSQISSLSAIVQKTNGKTTNREKLKFWLDEPMYPDNMDSVKQAFWSSYPQATGDLRLIQLANAQMLRQLKKICDMLGIQFWLHGGSLVGAIRHEGCVPWDDDVDIGMMRHDMLKLSEYLRKSDSNYEVAEYYFIALACRSYRFRRKDITADFFVDIFPYDYYRCTTDFVLSDWKKLVTFKSGMLAQYRAIAKEYSYCQNNVRLDEYPALKKELDRLIDGYIKKFEGSPDDGYIAWGIDNNFENSTRYAWHHGRIFTYGDIFPLKEVTYEGMICCAPAEFRKYVFAEYGIDYLEMPDNIGQAAHWNTYFNGQNIQELYDEFLKMENQENERI